MEASSRPKSRKKLSVFERVADGGGHHPGGTARAARAQLPRDHGAREARGHGLQEDPQEDERREPLLQHLGISESPSSTVRHESRSSWILEWKVVSESHDEEL